MKNNPKSFTLKTQNLSRQFHKEWIFKNFHREFSSQSRSVILGANGSGKSTLLQILSTMLSPSDGEVVYFKGDHLIKREEIIHFFSFASPYLELIEEFSLKEAILFQSKFKPFQNPLQTKDIIALTGLQTSTDKQIRHFSSGMKQRVKLSLAILADCPFLFLDEPLSNLDRSGEKWYQELIKDFCAHKTIVVCSNHYEEEYAFCSEEIKIEDYKG